ncbi:MAG: hypothetical protein ACOYXA_18515, partial [Bacteroidota bacterium]
LWLCEGFCAATREALDLFGAVATFACEEAMPARLSDQVLAITIDRTVGAKLPVVFQCLCLQLNRTKLDDNQ